VQKGPRQGQLRAYANAIAAGKSEREASAVFGDLAVLEKNLDAYVKRTRMSYFQIGSDKLPPPRIVTTVLSKGESEVMPLLIQSQRGVSREKALALLPQVRKVAERFPQDVGVLTALAEAEHDAGNDELAVAAADKALALDPSRVNAYVQKGYALHRAAEKAPPARRPALLKAAMKPFEALNRLENDHPLPLIYFYRSFAQQGLEPPDLARQALERASQLAPFDEGLTFEVALMHAREGKIGLAKSGLSALAGNPHGGRLAATAMKLGEAIAVLSEGTPWRGQVELLEIDAGEAVNVG
jgi:tetratricopeptide (TPR) repeat protein